MPARVLTCRHCFRKAEVIRGYVPPTCVFCGRAAKWQVDYQDGAPVVPADAPLDSGEADPLPFTEADRIFLKVNRIAPD